MKALSVTTYQTQAKLFLIIFAVFILTGCPWFDDDSNEEEVAQPIVAAPQANFSVSLTEGDFPLSVSFIDTSSQGSSDITSWLWDFGDGATSSESSPNHIYQQAGSYQVSLQVTTSVGSNTYILPTAIKVNQPLAILNLIVADKNGVVIPEVEASSDSFSIASSKESQQALTLKVSPDTKDGVIRVAKAGYLDGIVFFEGIQSNESRHITLLKRAPAIKVDAFLGGRYTGHLGVSVDIPAESLVRADGTVVTSEVDLFITPIDTSDPLISYAFPGSFYGAMNNSAGADDQGILLSYGVVDITFELNGETLQLKEGMEATLTLPVFSNVDIDGGPLSNNMPVWTLNEETGIWIYEDEGILIADSNMPNGIAVEAKTSHFTRFNCDINPPLMYRTNSFSGSTAGSGGRSTPQFVDVNVNIQGATIGQEYIYTHAIKLFGLVSRRNRSFVYDGSNISFQTLQNIEIGTKITSVENPDINAFDTAVASNDPTLLTLDLMQPPSFYATEMRVKPILERINNKYTVTKNTIFVGASFSGTDGATFTADLLTQPLILGSGIYHEIEVDIETAVNPAVFTIRIENDYGEEEVIEPVVLLNSMRPDTGITWGEYIVDSDNVLLKWRDVEGADSVDIYKVGTDNSEVLIDGIDLDETTNASHDYQLTETFAEGEYIKLVFANDYGTSEVYLPVNKLCPPFSDLCVQAAKPH